jgi:hypothetical protein
MSTAADFPLTVFQETFHIHVYTKTYFTTFLEYKRSNYEQIKRHHQREICEVVDLL